MTKRKDISLLTADSELRRRAIKRLCNKKNDTQTLRSAEEIQRLVQELEIHEIELEMQNMEILQTRNDLEKSLEKYTDLYDFAPVGYLTLDGNGQISVINLAGAGLLGGERSQLAGRSFESFIPPNSRPFFANFLEKVLASQIKESCEIELLQRGKPAVFVQVEAMATVSGQEYRLALIDISERKSMETHLIQAEKMETIVLLAGGIAHDIDNILNVIAGYGAFSEMNMPVNDPLRINLEQIIAAADRGANLTRNLLNFSRMLPINPHPVNVNTIIEQVESFLKMVIGNDIEFQSYSSGGELTVTADSGQLEQVFISLATNAQHAMPDGGILSFSTEPCTIDLEFIKKNGFGEPGSYALVSVTDSGSGMDRDTVKRIFEPFFTTKTHGNGTGLGLSIVYNTVRRHGGFINVISQPEKGSTFRIHLPLSDVDQNTTEMPPSVPGL